MNILRVLGLLVISFCIGACFGSCPDVDPSLLPWSSSSSWASGKVPVARDIVNIPSGKRILLDVSPPRLLGINIAANAALVWKSVDGLKLFTDYITIDGSFIIGSEKCPFTKKATVTLTGKLGSTYNSTEYGGKYIGVGAGGELQLHGKDPSPSWTYLNKTIPNPKTSAFTTSSMILTLAQPVSWKAGDQIVLGTTDYTYLQSEVVTLTDCPECAPNQVKMADMPLYYHYGEVTYGVDERAAVGLLTRSILIQGEMENSCYGSQLCNYFPFDGYGGHLKIIKNFAAAFIENVEFYHMGQLHNLAYYPIHFHHAMETGGIAYVKGNSIHRSFSRCVTIHMTHGLLVKDNVAFDTYGHCYFIEDGSEERNILDGNLGLLTRYGWLLPTDRNCSTCTSMVPRDYNGNPTTCSECNALATFWIANPNNILRNNVAGGSPVAGIWYIFPQHPTGDSEPMGANVWPAQLNVLEFTNNKCHSNGIVGLQADNMLKRTQPSAAAPLQYLGLSFGGYRPRTVPGDLESPYAIAMFNGLQAYRNRWRGVWVRGGEIRFNNSVFAENVIGITMASEGYYPTDAGSSQDVWNSLFVGETDNLGMVSHDLVAYNGKTLPGGWWNDVRGLEIYDGPLSVVNSTFLNFFPNPIRNASAINWMRFDEWQIAPTNFMINSKFPDNSTRFYKIYETPADGTKNLMMQDIDGTLTGYAKTTIVNNNPYFKTQNCVAKPEADVAICRGKYGQVFYDNPTSSTTAFKGKHGGANFVKDEQSSYTLELEGLPNANPTNSFVVNMMLNKSYTLHFPHSTPPTVALTKVSFDQGDWVRIGVCYPKSDVQFTVTSYSYNGQKVHTQVSSLMALTNETYFYDSSTGLVFVLMRQRDVRSAWADVCTVKTQCERILIAAKGTGLGTNTGDCRSDAYPKYSVTEATVPVTSSCNGFPNLVADKCGICGGDGSVCAKPPTTPPTTSPTTTPTKNPTKPPTTSPTVNPTKPPTTPPTIPGVSPTTTPTTTPSAPPTKPPTTPPTIPGVSPTTPPTTPLIPGVSPTTPPTIPTTPPTIPGVSPTPQPTTKTTTGIITPGTTTTGASSTTSTTQSTPTPTTKPTNATATPPPSNTTTTPPPTPTTGDDQQLTITDSSGVVLGSSLLFVSVLVVMVGIVV